MDPGFVTKITNWSCMKLNAWFAKKTREGILIQLKLTKATRNTCHAPRAHHLRSKHTKSHSWNPSSQTAQSYERVAQKFPSVFFIKYSTASQETERLPHGMWRSGMVGDRHRDTETVGALYPLQRKQVCREQCRARWPERPQRWQGPMLPIKWVAAKSSTFPPLLIFLNSSVYSRSVRMLKIREAPVPLFLHRDLLWSDLTYSIRKILLSIRGEGVSYRGQKLMTFLEEGNQCPEC